MIEVTPRAIRLLSEELKGTRRRRIRLFVKLGSCGIRCFGIEMGKPRVTDAVFEKEGFQFIIDKRVLEGVAPVKVDSDGFGFRISGSGIAPQHGCGNCGFLCGDGNICTNDCVRCTHRCERGVRLLGKQCLSP